MLLNWGRHHARLVASGEPNTAGGRRRAYPGWRMVWALAVTETISYGVLYYSFAAFLLPMQHSLGFSQATLTGAFSLSVLLTGAGAIPAGAWLDCCGARGLMTAGSLLGAGCVLVWARAGDVAGLYLAFAGIGLAGAAVQYQPAFATVNAYFDAQRRKALLTITMVAGLASTVFLPACLCPADQPPGLAAGPADPGCRAGSYRRAPCPAAAAPAFRPRLATQRGPRPFGLGCRVGRAQRPG